MNLLFKGAELLGVRLTEQQVSLFQVYADELIRWNRRFNLTAITDYEGIQTKHFVDSLTCLLAFPGVLRRDKPPYIVDLSSPEGLRAIDVGAGAGFPGIPLKIICPGINLTLLDSVAKKTRFLNHIVQELGLAGVDVVNGRAEEVARSPHHRETYHVVLSRAVAELAALAELCLPFARVGGRVIAPKKGEVDREIQRAGKAIELLGGCFGEKIEIELPGLLDLRYLVVVDKVSRTPPTYPRRPGIPAKKPLGHKA